MAHSSANSAPAQLLLDGAIWRMISAAEATWRAESLAPDEEASGSTYAVVTAAKTLRAMILKCMLAVLLRRGCGGRVL